MRMPPSKWENQEDSHSSGRELLHQGEQLIVAQRQRAEAILVGASEAQFLAKRSIETVEAGWNGSTSALMPL